MNRDKAIVGLFVVLAAVSAVGFGLMFSYLGRDPCMEDGLDGGSCPTMADVNGVRYGVGTARGLVDIEGALVVYAPITRTNVPEQLPEMTAYAIGGIDPGVVLVARSASTSSDGTDAYRLMFPLKGGGDRAFPALCRYLPKPDRSADERCGGVTPP